MAYDKFEVLVSKAYPLPIENVDTDQILPARYLKATERTAFDKKFFRDWRFKNDSEDQPIEDFILNDTRYAGSKILIGGKNFGSGSSREHAVWSVYDFGLRCVISSFFADIFRNNCLNIGVLPVQLSPKFVEILLEATIKNPETEIKVDLPNQVVTLLLTGVCESFEINDYKKRNMLNGFDDIDYLKNMKNAIMEFSEKRPF
jgi:3-isopropylmalate/(R)-2-methylmalate dehydratase small subunit